MSVGEILRNVVKIGHENYNKKCKKNKTAFREKW